LKWREEFKEDQQRLKDGKEAFENLRTDVTYCLSSFITELKAKAERLIDDYENSKKVYPKPVQVVNQLFLKDRVVEFTNLFPTVDYEALYEQARKYISLFVQLRSKLKKNRKQFVRRAKEEEEKKKAMMLPSPVRLGFEAGSEAQ